MSTVLPQRFDESENDLNTHIDLPPIAIIYHTSYGSTLQYAKWISEHFTDADLYHVRDFNDKQINNYDIFLIGGSTRRGWLTTEHFIKKHAKSLESKYVFVFATGIIPWRGKKRKDAYLRIPLHVRSSIQYIKLPGKVDPDKLNLFDRLYLSMNGIGQYNQMNKKFINPIIDYVHSIRNQHTQK
ncbi:flavodoxin domain-containing protein [Candidatus Dojkabacteria bacterium]|uniref:Flavodoxin domain-containing protein n=1 Tax=Candidatus Dojkabacteria bacterium TaxID=2099670 RepID=A0A955I8P8_9BACT|nr:flavodoxin domain-containing protein [Candidatus Dojkabacteria bacterium]